jgi:ribosomal-protein-alanine N-acetyltransferase
MTHVKIYNQGWRIVETKPNIILREPGLEDETCFLDAMNESRHFHSPFVTPPQTSEAYKTYMERTQQPNQKSYLAFIDSGALLGVFNISEIVRGAFQSAYLGYYANANYAGQGLMSQALMLVLNNIFNKLSLHRIEANIQPSNTASINFVKNNGFLKEGFSPRYLKIKDEWCDHIRFALTYEDWLAIKP